MGRADAAMGRLLISAVACIMLSLIPSSADGGSSGTFILGSGHKHVGQSSRGGSSIAVRRSGRSVHRSHRAHKFRHHFGRKHLWVKKHHRFKRHIRLKRRGVFVPTYYYGYGRHRGYRNYSPPKTGYSPTPAASPTPTQPSENRPPSPKWVHVGGSEGLFQSSDRVARSSANCLTVRTDITVDGAPMEAVGQACLQADGSWQLVPLEPAQN